jgi:hypothetical protein
VCLINPGKGIECFLYRIEKELSYAYNWMKGASKGTCATWLTESGGYETTGQYSNFKLYADAKILGENCLVYSCTYTIEGYTDTEYNYVSRKSGALLKNVSVGGGQQSTTIYFQRSNMNKDDSFFKAPANVTFTSNE